MCPSTHDSMCLGCARLVHSPAQARSAPRRRRPSHVQVEKLVLFIVARLGMQREDLVLGMRLFDVLAQQDPGVVCTTAIRKLLLGCFIVATKINNDYDLLLSGCVEKLGDSFTALTVAELKRIEGEVCRSPNAALARAPPRLGMG